MSKATDQIYAFAALGPREFPVLKTITVSQGDGAGGVYEQRLTLVLMKDVDDDRESLFVEFRGVRNLKITQPHFSVINIHLQILEGSAFPDVHSTFFVSDAEQESVVCFECKDFEAYKA